MRRSARSSPSGARRRRNDSTRLSESIRDAQKKARAELRPLEAGNLAAGRRVSSERQAEVGDHAPVAPARGAVGKELCAVVGAAPGRDRDGREAERLRLAHQDRPQVALRRPRGRRPGRRRGVAERRNDFTTYFIPPTANTNTTMHYNITLSPQPRPPPHRHPA